MQYMYFSFITSKHQRLCILSYIMAHLYQRLQFGRDFPDPREEVKNYIFI